MGTHGGVAPARRRGLADEVADRVREAIFDGTYPSGTQLRESELSGALEVSRGPVREALTRLEGEGLVRSAWHRGATVTELTDDDIAELDSLRDALEHLAVQRVTRHADERDMAAIERAAERMERAEDAYDLVVLDLAFHDAVYAAARHRRLRQAWDAIRQQVRLFLVNRVRASSLDYLERVPGEHRELAEVLRSRDTSAALALFAAHRRHALDVLTRDQDPVAGGGPAPGRPGC
ncbi:GntR family transcriptional regulator [Nocardiopsis metallicus]|uniref:DNA-binding GntR family transcriptional regulator n=1 Tax=Nocardiopsis metallicus TaxID=179819 RepID=A0A840WDL0_9ACTN|nr:GntR family transcriptional regulator [Nocardiopsis metallicus]MBB5489386.1 DNA-binding GntR family transcriptional regulator [Nocardiopsis metallicus]